MACTGIAKKDHGAAGPDVMRFEKSAPIASRLGPEIRPWPSGLVWQWQVCRIDAGRESACDGSDPAAPTKSRSGSGEGNGGETG